MTCDNCTGDFTATYVTGGVRLCRECYFAPWRGPTIERTVKAVRQHRNKPRQGSH